MKKIILLIFALILFSGIALAEDFPPTPHAFYGTAKYTNGQNIPDGYIVTAELNGVISGSCNVNDGKYGYGSDTLIVLSYGQGGTIKFYINGNEANQDAEFEEMAVTNLDLTVKSPPSDFDGCGDGTCDDGETCSNCPVDCGSCSYDDNDDDSGDDSSSSSSSSSSSTQDSTTDDSNNQNDILSIKSLNEADKQRETSPGITGAVIGFIKTGGGLVVMIFAILIIVIGVGVIMLKRKTSKNE